MHLSYSQKNEYFSRVWQLVKKIPPGKVISYGQVAELLEPPTSISPELYRAYGARWVGMAMKACPENVPWQRVINAQGKISLPGEAGIHQQNLLLEEGIEFDQTQSIDFKIYGWITGKGGEPAEGLQGSLPGF